MAMTHTYELEIGDTLFKGEVEFSKAGVVSYTTTSDEKMGEKLTSIFKLVAEELSKSYEEVNNFKKFEMKLIE